MSAAPAPTAFALRRSTPCSGDGAGAIAAVALVIGSVAHSLLHHAGRPVLVVPPARAEE